MCLVEIYDLGLARADRLDQFFDRAATDDTITYFNRYFDADEVVARALRDMRRGKDVSVCGFSIRAQVLLTKLLHHRIVMKIWCMQQKK